jgi:hypothetical protein
VVPWLDHPKTGLKQVNRAVNSWFQIDASDRLEAEKRAVIVMPPGHIKTTFFSMEYPTYRIMKDRNFRGMIVQKNQDEAAKIVAAVQKRLDCDYYHELAERLDKQGDEPITCPVCKYGGPEGFMPQGRELGKKWGAYGFRVTGNTSGEKDDTFTAKGVGSQIQGGRADLIILDDVQDPTMAKRSPKDGDDKLEWFHDVILGRVYDWQSVVVCANFFSPHDFAHKLISSQEAEDFHVTQYPAILDEEKQKILCPEVWTFKGLMKKKKEVGAETWHFTWMQSEGGFAESTFTKEALDNAKDMDYELGTLHPRCSHVFMGVDPAISGYCAIVVWGLDQLTGVRYLIDVFNEQNMRNYTNVEQKILELARKYGPKVCAIERAGQQGSIIDNPDFTKELRAVGCRTSDYATRTGSGARSERDSFDISTVGALFDAGKVVLPYLDRPKVVDEYCEQLQQWRVDENGNSIKYLTRDMVMATLFAESEAFVIANRPKRDKPQPRSRAPKWVSNRMGGFAWEKEREPA